MNRGWWEAGATLDLVNCNCGSMPARSSMSVGRVTLAGGKLVRPGLGQLLLVAVCLPKQYAGRNGVLRLDQDFEDNARCCPESHLSGCW